jgi:hypothetical protein
MSKNEKWEKVQHGGIDAKTWEIYIRRKNLINLTL